MEKQAIDVAKALVRLSEVTIFELRGEWRRLHRMPPPMRLSRDLLIRGIIYQLQERALSGVSSKISLNSRSHLQHFQRPRHLTSARTHRAFRASAMNMWREAVVVV